MDIPRHFDQVVLSLRTSLAVPTQMSIPHLGNSLQFKFSSAIHFKTSKLLSLFSRDVGSTILEKTRPTLSILYSQRGGSSTTQTHLESIAMRYDHLPGPVTPKKTRPSPAKKVAGHIISQLKRPSRMRGRFVLAFVTLIGIWFVNLGTRHVVSMLQNLLKPLLTLI